MRVRRISAAAAILAALVGIGCSGDLTRAVVADKLEESKLFAKPVVFEFEEGEGVGSAPGKQRKDSTQRGWEALASVGFVEVTSLGPSKDSWFSDPPHHYLVKVTPKGRSAMKDLGGGRYSIEFARARLLEVTGIEEMLPTAKRAYFRYTYEPLGDVTEEAARELLRAIGQDGARVGGEVKSGATFTKYDDGWRLTSW